MLKQRKSYAAGLLFAAVLMVPSLAFCHQGPDSSSTQDPNAGSSTQQSPGTSTGDTTPATAGTTQGLFAKALNSAGALSGDGGPLQWGWLSLRSVSFLEYFDTISLAQPDMPGLSQSLTASQISAAIVLSHAFGSTHSTQLSIQYTPSLLLSGGNVYPNTLNQTAGFDTTFQLTPRLGLQVSDRFNYFGSQRDFSGLSLNVDYSLGTIATNTFLNGPGRVLYNSSSVGIVYLWNPTTTLTVTPMVGYQNSTSVNNAQQNLTAIYGGGQVIVSHALSSSQTIGVSYLGEEASYTNTAPNAGPQASSDGLIQDVLLTYGKQIGASWKISLGFGLTSNSGVDAQSSYGADAGISKSFKKMDFGLSFDRGHQFNGYITNGSTDRIDAVNTIRWTRRFTTNESVAYFQTVGSPSTTGLYATAQARFALTRSLGLNAGYAYTKQTGDGVYVENGISRLTTLGITWSPPTPVAY
jgi:hypothetical protein